MNDQSQPFSDEGRRDAVDFNQRAASVNWEPVYLSPNPEPSKMIWVWFKPQGIQNQITISIPPETFQNYSSTQQLNLLILLNAIRIEISQIAMISLFGTPVETSCQDHPVFHQSVMQPASGVDSYIHLMLAGESVPVAANTQATSGVDNDEREKNLRRAIDMDWNAVRGIETQLKVLRKQLDQMATRLNSLNRDLSPEETLHADQLDIRDWQDARRWLRDMASRMSRYLKEHDIGMTSSAGNRHRLNQIHQHFIVPGLPLEGVEHLQHEFETYRKMAHNLMQNMSAAHASAKTDGEQRAQQVLRRIAAKTRAARTRR